MREVGLNKTPLHITLRKSQAGHDGFRYFAGEDCDAGVVFGFCIKKIGVVAVRIQNRIGQLVLFRFQILNGDNVRPGSFQPGIQPLFHCLLQAVDV